LKKNFYILFLLISFCTTATFHAGGQIVQPDLPMVCEGSQSKYKIGSLFHGLSDFKWRVYHPFINSSSNNDTIFVKPEHIQLFARGDSILVTWDDPSYVGGFYTLEVTETTDYGCTGPRYTADLILNTNTIYIPVEDNDYLFTACAGKSITLDAGYFGQDSRYLWTGYPDSTKQTFITTTEGTYQVRIVDGNTKSCTYDTLRAQFNPLPYVWLGNDTTLFASQTLTLDATDNFTAYKWFDNGIDLNLNPLTSTLTVDGLSGNKIYKVTVTDINGCENSDDIKVSAADYSNLKIPAAFTPNGDQINDVWVFPRSNVQGDNAELYKYFDNVNVKVYVKVFSRWGKLVWESSSKFKFWDGKDMNGRDLPMDSYHYIIRFEINGREYDYKGSVTIIR